MLQEQKGSKIPKNVCVHKYKYLYINETCEGDCLVCQQRCENKYHQKKHHDIIQINQFLNLIKNQSNKQYLFINQCKKQVQDIYGAINNQLYRIFLECKEKIQRVCFNQEDLLLLSLIQAEKFHVLTCANIYYMKNLQIDKKQISKKITQIVKQFKFQLESLVHENNPKRNIKSALSNLPQQKQQQQIEISEKQKVTSFQHYRSQTKLKKPPTQSTNISTTSNLHKNPNQQKQFPKKLNFQLSPTKHTNKPQSQQPIKQQKYPLIQQFPFLKKYDKKQVQLIKINTSNLMISQNKNKFKQKNDLIIHQPIVVNVQQSNQQNQLTNFHVKITEQQKQQKIKTNKKLINDNKIQKNIKNQQYHQQIKKCKKTGKFDKQLHTNPNPNKNKNNNNNNNNNNISFGYLTKSKQKKLLQSNLIFKSQTSQLPSTKTKKTTQHSNSKKKKNNHVFDSDQEDE